MSLLDNINLLEGTKNSRRTSKIATISNRQSMKLEVQNQIRGMPQTVKGRGQSFIIDENSFDDNILK